MLESVENKYFQIHLKINTCYATNSSFLFRNFQNHLYELTKLHYVGLLRRSSLSPIQNQTFSEVKEPLPDMALIWNEQNDGICFWAIISSHNPSACSNNKYIQHKKHLLFCASVFSFPCFWHSGFSIICCLSFF